MVNDDHYWVVVEPPRHGKRCATNQSFKNTRENKQNVIKHQPVIVIGHVTNWSPKPAMLRGSLLHSWLETVYKLWWILIYPQMFDEIVIYIHVLCSFSIEHQYYTWRSKHGTDSMVINLRTIGLQGPLSLQIILSHSVEGCHQIGQTGITAQVPYILQAFFKTYHHLQQGHISANHSTDGSGPGLSVWRPTKSETYRFSWGMFQDWLLWWAPPSMYAGFGYRSRYHSLIAPGIHKCERRRRLWSSLNNICIYGCFSK